MDEHATKTETAALHGMSFADCEGCDTFRYGFVLGIWVDCIYYIVFQRKKTEGRWGVGVGA